MTALNEALQLSPFDPQVLNERAHLYNVAKDWDNAEKDFTTALEMATLVKSVWFQGRSLRGLGYIAIERKQWDKAVDYYHRALR